MEMPSIGLRRLINIKQDYFLSRNTLYVETRLICLGFLKSVFGFNHLLFSCMAGDSILVLSDLQIYAPMLSPHTVGAFILLLLIFPMS